MCTADAHPGITFVTALNRCKELGAALARFASADTVDNLKRSLETGLSSATQWISQLENDDVSHDTAVVAKLVLKNLDAAEHQFTCQPTPEGAEALQLLQRAVFGEGSLHQTYVECVYLASMAQAMQALELLTAALLDVVAPHNCLSLFNVAAACGCAPLARCGWALALRNFAHACRQDAAGLATMQEAHLMQLLRSNWLRVESELEVFAAVVAWTQHDVTVRLPGFAARLARCVRFDAVPVPDIYAMDDDPLVCRDKQAIALLAAVYMHKTMGVRLDCPLGHTATPGLRHCQRGGGSGSQQPDAAAAPQAQAHCGLAEHAGTHSTVFDAAVCSIERRRAQRQQEASAAVTGVAACPAAAGAAAQPALPPASPHAQVATTPSLPAQQAACQLPNSSAEDSEAGPRLSRRAGSRRTLFGAAAADSSSSSTQVGGLVSCIAQAPAPARTTAATAAEVLPASKPAAPAVVGGVALEMLMSPSRASLGALAAAPAALPPPATWESRKRLRFDD